MNGTPSRARHAHPLTELYEAMSRERDAQLRTWAGLPLAHKGALRSMWASARAGQCDPWLVALAGWRHLRAVRPWDFTTPDPCGWRLLAATQYCDVAERIVALTTTTSTTASSASSLATTTGDADSPWKAARVTGTTATHLKGRAVPA